MDDLISRSAAIDTLTDALCFTGVQSRGIDAVRYLPAIDAAPVQHDGTTTFIDTDDIDKFQSRIILTETKKSKFCRVFYEDDRSHGRWIDMHAPGRSLKCSECGNIECYLYNYCPNCGAKMDKEATT